MTEATRTRTRTAEAIPLHGSRAFGLYTHGTAAHVLAVSPSAILPDGFPSASLSRLRELPPVRILPFPVAEPRPVVDMRTGRAYMAGRESALSSRAADSRLGQAIKRAMYRRRTAGAAFRAWSAEFDRRYR